MIPKYTLLTCPFPGPLTGTMHLVTIPNLRHSFWISFTKSERKSEIFPIIHQSGKQTTFAN